MSNRRESRSFTDSSLVQLTLVRFREFWREPEAIFWVFVFPILLAGGLGVAFRNSPAEVIRIGVADSRVTAALRADPSLAVEELDLVSGETALRTGRVVMLIAPRGDTLVYRYDDTNPEARTARLLAERAIRRAAGAPGPIQADDQIVREPGSRYIDFVIPGLLGMNLMGSGIWGLGFTIVDARRRKLLKRLIAAPMRRWEFLLSFLLSRLLLLIIEVAVLLIFAILAFDVPIRGSLGELAFLCFLSSLAFSSLGLLIASRVRTIEAVSGLMNFVMLPMWILSGVFFSAERFPAAVQPLIKLIPLTAVIDALRANMLQGTSLTAMTWQLPVITGWLIGTFVLALKLFRWR